MNLTSSELFDPFSSFSPPIDIGIAIYVSMLYTLYI